MELVVQGFSINEKSNMQQDDNHYIVQKQHDSVQLRLGDLRKIYKRP